MANAAKAARVRMRAGGSVPSHAYIEATSNAAGNAIYSGDLVTVSTLGVVSTAATGTNTTFASGAITTTTLASNAVGVALSHGTFARTGSHLSATSTASTVAVARLTPGMELGVPVLHATNASALPVKTLEGGSFELVHYTMSDGTVTLGVAIDRTSSPTFVITSVPDGSVNDVNGIVYGVVVSGERDAGF